jgi:hypothetical protein
MGSSDTAGWVQAIGAILAIVGAFLVVNHQHRKERARDAEIEVEEVRAMLLSLRDDHVDDKPLRFWLWPTFKRR